MSADSDSDGFADQIELYIGTSPLDNCPDTATANDEADDKWPPDFTDNQFVNLSDVLAFSPHYGAVGTSDPKYNRRFDLNVDGNINDLDTAAMQPYWLRSCLSPP